MVTLTVKRKTIYTILAFAVITVILTAALKATSAAQVFGGKGFKKLPIYSVGRDDNKISISFDCAWGVDYTEELLTIMREENVKCTFFMVEFWVKKHPDYVKKIYDEGHETGTHSATHPHMSKLDVTAIEKELVTSSAAIEKITGEKPQTFRPPFGEYNDAVIETAQKLGLYPVQWDVDSLDWKNLSAEAIKERVLKRVKSGSIVLFHNQGLHTHEALRSIIKSLKAKGYEFVPIKELIYRDGYTIDSNGRQLKNS